MARRVATTSDLPEGYHLQRTYVWPMSAFYTTELQKNEDDEIVGWVVKVYDDHNWPSEPDPVPETITGDVEAGWVSQGYSEGKVTRTRLIKVKLK